MRRLLPPGLNQAACRAGAVFLLLAAPIGCPGTLEDPLRFISYEGGAGNVGSSGSGGSSGGGGTCDAPGTIFNSTCALSGCHNSTNAPTSGNLDLSDLTAANITARLINVPSVGMTSVLRINTADPAQSALVTKISSSPPFGARMPYGGTPLSAADIQCVTDWVDTQAANAMGGGGPPPSGDDGSSPSDGSSSDSSTSSSDSSSSGSGSSPTMEGGATVSFAASVYPNILMSNCTNHHAGANPSGGLDLSSESTAFQNLTTGSSTETGCNEQYVVSGDPNSSLLYQKIVGGASLQSACGVQMPAGAAPLGPTDVMTIQSWIQGGAAP
jgi:hypothetical protein